MSCKCSSTESCCTKPPNPWLNGSQGPQGCVCDQGCVGSQGQVERYCVEYPQVKSIEQEIVILDSKAVAYSDDAFQVNNALNTALISPRNYKETLGAIFYQNAASAVNATNAAAVIAPQVAAAAASSSAIAATTSARLAHLAACNAKKAVNSIINVSISDLTVLVAKVKEATDAALSAATTSNNSAQGVYNTAESVELSADNALTTAINSLKDVELTAALATCNAVPGSGAARLTWNNNNIAITTAKRKVELATNAAKAASDAVSSCSTVAVSTVNALNAVTLASSKTNQVNTLFTTATSANAAYAVALANYDADPPNTALLAIANSAYNAKIAANALLPPTSLMNEMVSLTAQASYLANIAAGNARTLSTTLDKEARAIARPTHNPVTPQMIATQTAAAIRFGAEAAAKESRLARASAAVPIPPPLPPPEHAEFSVRMPATPISPCCSRTCKY